MLSDFQFLEEVPTDHQKYVERLRSYLNDTEELNDLLGKEESTDIELYNNLIDTWEQINYEFDPTDLHINEITKIPWVILRQGAVLQVLGSKGILSSRNMLTYNDSGGITVKDTDTYGRYMALFNMLVNHYRRAVTGFKRNINMNGGYGGVDSEYSNEEWR